MKKQLWSLKTKQMIHFNFILKTGIYYASMSSFIQNKINFIVVKTHLSVWCCCCCIEEVLRYFFKIV